MLTNVRNLVPIMRKLNNLRKQVVGNLPKCQRCEDKKRLRDRQPGGDWEVTTRCSVGRGHWGHAGTPGTGGDTRGESDEVPFG